MKENWSQSRDSVLHSCERRYFYQYLVAARSNSRDTALREIAYLKRLRSIPAWVGEVFHSVIADELRMSLAGGPIDSNRIAELASTKIIDGYRASKHAAESGGLSDSQLILFEHEYGMPLPDNTVDDWLSRVRRWAENFTVWATANKIDSSLRSAERLWIEPNLFGPNPPGFELEGLWVFAKVDLAFLRKDGSLTVFDWKTGKIPQTGTGFLAQTDFQAIVYQLWPHLTMGVPCDKLSAHLVYVDQSPAESLERPMTEESRDLVLSRIKTSINRTRQFGQAWKDLGMAVSDLDYASSPGQCRTCNFKRLCIRSLEGGLDAVW